MNRQELFELIRKKRSFLCIGLDSDIRKIPQHLLHNEDPVFEFNKSIIDATKDMAIAYKPNLAFYESRGIEGWQSLEKTIRYLNALPQKVFTIADAKRGDIGNTSEQYAIAFFQQLGFDAITVAPYMGEDSVSPFFKYDEKWVILLALTSNRGAMDFQLGNLHFSNEPADAGTLLFEAVLRKSLNWGSPENLMFVVGATQADKLLDIRKIVKDHFLLIPGVGAQGGSLQDVARFGMNEQCGLIVNSSRNIIFASGDTNYAVKAGEAAREMQQQMESLLQDAGLI